MKLRTNRCPDCEGGFLMGDGKCAQCHGTGINTQLDSIQPKCPYCAGTGVCKTCDGTGMAELNEITDLFH